MNKSNKIKNPLQEEFLEELKRLRPFIVGKGRLISKEVGIHHNTYSNYCTGFGSNPETMDAILKSARKFAKKLSLHLQNTIQA